MSPELRKKLDAALAREIITPTPHLSLAGPQGGRNFLVLTPAERHEIISRLERILDARGV